MTSALLRLSGLLLLASLGTVSAHAQLDVFSPTAPLSPNLSPALTVDPETAPITTLSTDLLAPQRPYIFDPSGAAIISNGLNPEIYSSSLNWSRVETDTQIRDSSQTGQISPYSPAARRLGLTFSPDEDTGSLGTQYTSNGSFHGALSGDGQSGTGNAYQSSWGASSSFAPNPQQSSWGTHRLVFDRFGNNRQPNSPGVTEGSQGESAIIGDSNGNSVGTANAYSIARNTASNGSSIGGLPIGSLKDRSTNPRPSRYAGSRTNPSGYGTINGSDRGTSSENKPRQSLTRGVEVPGGTGIAMGGKSKDMTGSTANSLNFPQANYSQSPLGDSPFSSPGGIGELHFLNPDISAATRHMPSWSDEANGGATSDWARQSFVQRDALATSASHYGLTTHTGAERLATGNRVKSNGKSSHLNTGLLDSPNP